MLSSRPAARSFRDLLVWRKAHEFVLAVYAFTAAFPRQETYGLALQMRRAAVSIPANIAEGFRRRSKAEKARYMNIAEGSLEECRLLPHLGAGPRLWRYYETRHRAGRSQPSTQRLRGSPSDFLDFWLLTSVSRRDIKGEALG